ncbi:MAG: DNA gyrase inhibitor YacG [Blastocatellia bacterium AA13]|nr:MAG: DNA gyrase inhibitor YacG [Blastocatellia bacterium AA13]
MKCPICERDVKWKDNPFRPFCSERCRTIDLGRWASEEYSVAAPLDDNQESLDHLEP